MNTKLFLFIGVGLTIAYASMDRKVTKGGQFPQQCMKCVDNNNSYNTFLEFCASDEKAMNTYFNMMMDVNEYKAAMEEYNPKFPNQDIECKLV